MKRSVWTVDVVDDQGDDNYKSTTYEVVAESIQDAIRGAIEKHGYGCVISAQRGREVVVSL